MELENFKSEIIETPLGEMVAIGDDEFLYLLEFKDNEDLNIEIKDLQNKTKKEVVAGSSKAIKSIKKELDLYFKKQLKEFKTPLYLTGTLFQKNVWQHLMTIPYGTTSSYLEMAKALRKPTAFRAVANANGKNKMAIVIPCHRVIKANGDLCGYNGGVHRKKWLLDHEGGIRF